MIEGHILVDSLKRYKYQNQKYVKSLKRIAYKGLKSIFGTLFDSVEKHVSDGWSDMPMNSLKLYA